jgi:hypothetical protein
MNRRNAIYIIILVLILITTGCNKNPDVESVVIEETTEVTETIEAAEPTETAETLMTAVATPIDRDIARALEAGFIDPVILESGETQITYKEFSEMLSSMIEEFDASKVDEWRAVAARALNSERKMRREDGMLTLYYAADVLGVSEWPNSDWGIRHEEIGDQWDEISGHYPEFPNWGTETAPFEEAGWDYMTSAYFYSMGRVSRYTYQSVFDYDPVNKSMHPAEPFTVADAIKATVRLKDSITVYVPLEQAEAVNHIPESLLTSALAMPSVNEEHLPDWHGYAYALWDNPTCYNWRYFSENTVKQLSDIGFNFLRMVYHLNELFVETDEGYVVNTTTFDNLDDIIGWCSKYNIHITIQLHQIPGMGTNGPADLEYAWDIMENPKHYQDSMSLYDYMAKRYKNVPSNLLSFTILSEPPKSYFSFEDHAKLVEDLAGVIRKYTPDRMVIAHALNNGEPLYWMGATSFMPNYELDPSIVQAESFYPWHNLRRSAYTAALNNWPYDEAPQINNLVRGNGQPFVLKGDFATGTEVVYYINGINEMQYKPEAVCEADGVEIARIPLYGFTEGEDNCSSITEDKIAEFGNNGQYNGYEFRVILPENAKEITLFVTNDDRSFVTIGDIMIKHPAADDRDYIVIDNRYQPTGINYEYGPFTTTLIHCNEIWNETAAIVNILGDGTYSCEQHFDKDIFDMNSARAYFDMWENWAQETGGRYMDFEFTSLLSMPEAVRVNYMESILSIFDTYDIPWVFSADTSGSGGIIIYKGAETMDEFPEWEPKCILPADGSYSINSNYDYDCYYDDPVIKVMQEHMK